MSICTITSLDISLLVTLRHCTVISHCTVCSASASRPAVGRSDQCQWHSHSHCHSEFDSDTDTETETVALAVQTRRADQSFSASLDPVVSDANVLQTVVFDHCIAYLEC